MYSIPRCVSLLLLFRSATEGVKLLQFTRRKPKWKEQVPFEWTFSTKLNELGASNVPRKTIRTGGRSDANWAARRLARTPASHECAFPSHRITVGETYVRETAFPSDGNVVVVARARAMPGAHPMNDAGGAGPRTMTAFAHRYRVLLINSFAVILKLRFFSFSFCFLPAAITRVYFIQRIRKVLRSISNPKTIKMIQGEIENSLTTLSVPFEEHN